MAPALLLACAHARTPEQQAMIAHGDCAELLQAADRARADGERRAAEALAAACPADKLAALADASPPEQALLWCGRATAAHQKGCDSSRIADLFAALKPHLTLGPPDENGTPDPLLAAALKSLGPELNLAWDPDPDVIVGKLSLTIDHATSPTTAVVEVGSRKVRIPATQHRFIARVEAQVELADKTRVLRAQHEVRDNTWDAQPRDAVQAKFDPAIPAQDELKRRAAEAWLRSLARALAANPPETVDVNDAKGCVAYGLSLNINAGDRTAAARGKGDPARIAACETILGEPAGAGIPVP